MSSSHLSTAEHVEEKSYHAEVLQDPLEDTLHRGLKARHMSMIAIGGAVGTGLIMSSGTALVRGGPLGLCLGFLFVGLICFLTLAALGEMAAYLPHKRGLAGYATRFADPALGFALGWIYLLKYLVAPASQINSAGIVMQYWTVSVPIEVWTASYIILVVIMNLLGVRVFGEVEFWMSGLKIISLMSLIFLGIVIDLGGNPKHDRIGFRYWQHPNGPMGSYLASEVHNESLSIFLGFWSTLTTALFAYIGSELVAVTAGEAQNPRETIPRAVKATFLRIFVFYIGSVFAISLIVPSTSNELFVANSSHAGAAASPFIVGISLVGIKVLNHVLNAMILLFTISSANSDLYIGSRTLYGLAVEGKAPSIFTKVDKRGLPWVAVLVVSIFTTLTFLNVKSSSATVFAYGVNLLSAFGAITWMTIAYSHIRFMQALKAQGVSRNSLPYRAPCQPFGSWFVLISTGIILFFKGFDTFFPFTSGLFITSYLPIPLFFAFWIGYKLRFRTRLIPASKVDLITGKKEIDEEEERFVLLEKARRAKMSRWRRLADIL
ncbi:dicarboxylic amino acid permease [Rhizopogon vinicolor AM-OR11-026]|uniref:Dicarboxylic amino acid permease n=1 Tax=Rhizopogon vinicolor AM-OR11-026 TaxID=1314800 RepID=A0A1B7NIJ8_9AGAM|nr:dicarboxylic amino acid permease [Rhizopogon vinicolor AM-OR11-026]